MGDGDERDRIPESTSVEARRMIEWFLAHYEDPAESLPHDEGEYVWIHGGPYHPEDELEEAFPDADVADVEEAVDYLQGLGYEWVRLSDLKEDADAALDEADLEEVPERDDYDDETL